MRNCKFFCFAGLNRNSPFHFNENIVKYTQQYIDKTIDFSVYKTLYLTKENEIHISAKAKKGIKELIVIAQDTTSYGKDIYGKPSLVELLVELNKIEELSWIRIMYNLQYLY